MFDVAGLIVNGQTLLILAASIVFCGLLFLYFEFTLQGKALRATAINRIGARLVGIRPTSTGTIAYLLASLLAGISGVLIAPVTTIFYDSGFLLGLKAFVGAIIGAMVSYPVTALGAVMVGLLESFTSFWLSAYKEVAGLQPAHSRAALALAELRRHRGGRGRGMTRLQFRLVSAVGVLLLALAPALLSPFSITLLNFIGIYALAVLGLVLLSGIGGMLSFGQAAFVGIAAYATAWLTVKAGYSPWIGLVVGRRAHRPGRRHPGRGDLAAGRPLPVAQHHRLGAGDLLPVRQRAHAGAVQRHQRNPADRHRRLCARRAATASTT